MRLRTKILLAITAALALSYSVDHCQSSRSYSGKRYHINLQQTYGWYNSEYFDDTLPRDVVLDWSATGDDEMAHTTHSLGGRFNISFNDRYTEAERVANETMLHEQCHIKTWGNVVTPEEVMTGRHTRAWRACMLELDLKGAFRHEIIDYYDGK
jgi:hypothetical protein